MSALAQIVNLVILPATGNRNRRIFVPPAQKSYAISQSGSMRFTDPVPKHSYENWSAVSQSCLRSGCTVWEVLDERRTMDRPR